jgi:hypothetical protein
MVAGHEERIPAGKRNRHQNNRSKELDRWAQDRTNYFWKGELMKNIWRNLMLWSIVAFCYMLTVTIMAAFCNPGNLAMVLLILCLGAMIYLINIAIEQYQKERNK